MSVRILGGVLKGSKIAVPPKGTRPTAVLLRRRLYDSVQSLKGKNFYDLCAGSGVMGFEAYSRGACAVHFVDQGKLQVSYLKKNIAGLQLDSDRVFVYSSDVLIWLKKNLDLFSNKDVIIFFDPPYDKKELYFNFLKLLPKTLHCEVIIELSNKTSFYKDVCDMVSVYKSKLISQGEKIFLRIT